MRILLPVVVISGLLLSGCNQPSTAGQPVGPPQITGPNTPGAPPTTGAQNKGGDKLLAPGQSR